MPVSAPHGAVTLVFTDVQGSTGLWEGHTDAMRSALITHNNVMRQLLVQHGGYEVKTEGDAFMLAFASAQAAVAFCLHAQNALLDADWPVALAAAEDATSELDAAGKPIWCGLRVRMGVHCGAPEHELNAVTGRMDYFGPMVNRAARVASVAHGGQIIISDDVRGALDLAALHTPVEQDLGEHWLKGLKSVEHLFSLVPQCLRGRRFEPPPALPAPVRAAASAFDSSPEDHFLRMLSARSSLDVTGTLHKPEAAPVARPVAALEPQALEIDESKLRVNREKAAAAAEPTPPPLRAGLFIVGVLAFAALLAAGAVLTGVVPLLARPHREIVHFVSEPPGATVTIEGRERGLTPLDLANEFPDGIYEARVTKLGYEPVTVIFQGARTATIKADLRIKR